MFKSVFITGSILTALFITTAFAQPPRGIEYDQVSVCDITADVVTISPQVGFEIRPVMASGGPGRSESFDSFLRRCQPAAAINGTFFSKKTLLPVGYIVSDGRVLYHGRMGTALAIRYDGGVDIIRLPRGRSINWEGYESVLSCGPTLVWNGEISLSPRAEGFRDPSVYAARPRSVLGVKPDNTMLFVTITKGVTLSKLAVIMIRLGCRYAINLDGGSSVALSVGGSIIHRPARSLTNVLTVKRGDGTKTMLSTGLPRGLDWRYYRKHTIVSNSRIPESPVPKGYVALRWAKGRIILGPAKDDPTVLDLTGDMLPIEWRIELRIDGQLRGFISPPCRMPMSNVIPAGGKMEARLVDGTGQRVSSGVIEIKGR